MPRAGFILILDMDGVTGDVLLDGGSLGCGQSGGLARKGFREDIVELVCKSASNRDPSQQWHKALIFLNEFVRDGVPIGAEWDPRKRPHVLVISMP